jgi:hypothetical protein
MRKQAMISRAADFARVGVVAIISAAVLTNAAPTFSFQFDKFEGQPQSRWSFFANTVMGGESSGWLEFVRTNSGIHARLTGDVSTADNGGFIQIRRQLDSRLPAGVTGIRLFVRGNNERYYIRLRTRGTMLPWQYYQSGFEAGTNWTEVRLPLSEFEAFGNLLRKRPAAWSIRSVGIVAYGRDHKVNLEVREIGFY